MPVSTPSISRSLNELRRALLRRRRIVTALLAGLAVLAAVHIWAPSPPPTTAAVVAAHDLAAGTSLTADDLRVVALPPDVVPAGTAASPAPLLGATLAGPMRSGEPVTDQRVVGPGLLSGYPAGLDAMPVRLPDPDVVGLLHVGDQVDVLAATGRSSADAETVASAVTVVALPTRSDASSDGRLVVLALAPDQVARVAEAVATTQVSVAIRH